MSIQASITKFLYKGILKRILFRIDPEIIHDRMVKFGATLGKSKIMHHLVSFCFNYHNHNLTQTVNGITFKNPVGLSAGFDKNAELGDILPQVGFGFAEFGSITGRPCTGNPKPRLWRLKKSKGLVVYYGLKNDGCEKISERLTGKKFEIPIGISLGKTNDTQTVVLEEGIADYIKAYKAFAEKGIGDYYTINISCPNTHGGEPFVDPERLDLLLRAFNTLEATKPIFLKMPPDLTKKEVNAILEMVKKHDIAGFICANLTKNKEKLKLADERIPELGGISGKPTEELANDLIRHIYLKTEGQYTIIGCGGIFSATDAYKKIRAGATLLQLITGMIYEGPQLIGEINRGLVKLLKKDGFKNISEAVGADYKNKI